MKVDYNFNLKKRGIAMSKRGSGSSARAGSNYSETDYNEAKEAGLNDEI